MPGISNPWGLTDLFLVCLYIYTGIGKHHITSIIYLISQNRFDFFEHSSAFHYSIYTLYRLGEGVVVVFGRFGVLCFLLHFRLPH